MLADLLQRVEDYASALVGALPAHNVPLMMGLAVGIPVALILLVAARALLRR
jgi:hypothetical protein